MFSQIYLFMINFLSEEIKYTFDNRNEIQLVEYSKWSRSDGEKHDAFMRIFMKD